MSTTDTPPEEPRRPEEHDDHERSAAADETRKDEVASTRGTPLTQQLGRIFVAIIAVLFGVFAVVNAQFVDFDWIFGQTEVVEQGGERTSGGVPLIVLLTVSFVLGALAGWFATWRRRRHHRDPS